MEFTPPAALWLVVTGVYKGRSKSKGERGTLEDGGAGESTPKSAAVVVWRLLLLLLLFLKALFMRTEENSCSKKRSVKGVGGMGWLNGLLVMAVFLVRSDLRERFVVVVVVPRDLRELAR
jgi:hypothetical protein